MTQRQQGPTRTSLFSEEISGKYFPELYQEQSQKRAFLGSQVSKEKKYIPSCTAAPSEGRKEMRQPENAVPKMSPTAIGFHYLF